MYIQTFFSHLGKEFRPRLNTVLPYQNYKYHVDFDVIYENIVFGKEIEAQITIYGNNKN